MGTTAKASPQGLEKVKQATDSKGWRKTSPVFADAACVSTATLKRFWRSVPISLDSFESICRAVNLDFAQVIATESPEEKERSHNPNKSTKGSATNKNTNSQNNSFSNNKTKKLHPNSRQALRNALRQQLLASVRILAITGLTGIGKTTLAHQLASDLEAKGYCKISLSCDPSAPLTLASLVHALSKCAHSDSFIFSLSGLSDRLTAQKYLFIIDNCEHLLSTHPTSSWGQFQSNTWHPFFQSVLTAPTCNSRFILTSQDIPNAIYPSQKPPTRSHICALAGLTPAEQTALFRTAGLTNPDQLDCLAKIGQAYAGHPLALQTIARDIVTHYQSNAFTYWRHSATASLHSHSQALQSVIQPRLIQTIARLKSQSPEAFELLCASSPYTANLTSQSWKQIAQSIKIDPSHYRNLLDFLCDRALLIPTVIQNQLHFHQHPLIRSLMLTQIHGYP